ncbi:MAG: hypothetical protein NC040_09065 [Muribaculaceae bacterium]|nr:hypothetical protein [Alistipes senegalensis]MCM1474197.1 hypothetical protein [Muribaculaceae bacterium]
MKRKNFTENHFALKKCERIYSFIFWAYALSCIPYACAIFIYAVLESLILGNILDLIRNFLLTLAVFVSGLVSVYKKEPKFTWLPVIIAFIAELASGFHDTFSLFLGISLVSSILLTLVHKKYRWLEQQEGFPYFNEFFEEQKNKSALNEHNEHIDNNPYQQTIIERYKTSSGKMDEI